MGLPCLASNFPQTNKTNCTQNSASCYPSSPPSYHISHSPTHLLIHLFSLFAACRVALSASALLTFPPNFLAPTCPLLPPSISQSSIASSSSNKYARAGGSGSGSPFPSSPSHIPHGKRGANKRKSMFGGGVSSTSDV